MSTINSLDGTKQIFTQEQLEDQLSAIQKMLNTIDIAIWSYDVASQKYSHMSDAFTQITGFPSGKLMEMSFWKDIIHQGDLAVFEHISAIAERGFPVLKEFRINHAAGERKWIQIRIIPTIDKAGRMNRLDGVIIDITSTKLLEEALLRSEQRYKSLFEHNSDVVCELDLEGNVLAVNPAAERITGEALYGSVDDHCSIIDIFGIDNVRRVTDHFENAKKQYSELYEVTTFHQNGKTFSWDLKNVPIFIKNKMVGTYAIAKDITARKTVERDLAESEERYRRLIELSPQPMVSHQAGIIFYMNPAGYQLLGANAEVELIGKSIFDIVHPDDRGKAVMRSQKIKNMKFTSSTEYKIVRMDGHVLETETTAIYDEKSETTLVLFSDITERKKLEKELMEKEERYRSLVELSPIAIAVYKDGIITYINPAGLRMVASDRSRELLTNQGMDWIHPDYREYARERINNTLLNGYSPPGEIRIINSNGCTIEVSMTSIYDPHTSSIQLMFEDITERKQIERDLMESEKRYSHLQMSLDRFSQDLFGVMKVDDIERRLVAEVCKVMSATQVSLIEIDQHHMWKVKVGEQQLTPNLEKELFNHKLLPVCKIVESENSYLIKISERRGNCYLLGFGEKTSELKLKSKRVWLETIVRYVSVLFDNFLFIEDLMKELEQHASEKVAPSWLLRLLFSVSENERKRLSQDLHDSALQEQIIWYRKLDVLLTNGGILAEAREQLEEVSQGLLDVMYQIRNTCNELRPPMLKEEGLISSLEALFNFTQLRSNYSISFDAVDFEVVISDDLLLGLYRIVQELLANASKHSQATEVRISLSKQRDRIGLEYIDNGIGMDMTLMQDFLSGSGMGIYGVKERVRSMDGTIEFHSSLDEGLIISLSLPTSSQLRILY